ncbi:CAP domain-containing protein [Streptomyces daliensis]
MGRHRRVTAAPSPDRAPAPGAHRHRAHGKRGPAPVRTGLLGASAALAVGAVAVASGLIPGPGALGGGQGADSVQAGGPPDPQTRAPSPTSPSASERDPGSSRDADRKTAPSAQPSDSGKPSEKPSGSPSRQPSDNKGDGDSSASRAGSGGGKAETEGSGNRGGTTGSSGPEAAAEAEVLSLVNQERAQAGCKPVTADSELATLAGDFSEDMARLGFFDHTSPDGQSPWDRAEEQGIDDLGGENIARGQANAQSVMDSWMNSPGHKANILNCDYRTLGVGAHFAEGGPWWTQDFGF